METALAIRSFWEIMVILMVTLAILHEDKFIIFEANVERIIRRKIRMHKRRKAMAAKKAAQKNADAPCRKNPMTIFDVQVNKTESSRRNVA